MSLTGRAFLRAPTSSWRRTAPSLGATVGASIQVLHAESKRQVATINYAFEPSQPPFDDEPQVFLDPMNPQSELSDQLQDAFETLMLTDTAYVKRLHRHHDMWKRVVDDPKHPDHAKVCPPGRPDYGGPAFPKKPVRRESPKVGPNELCPCGSGKKFKVCHYPQFRAEGKI